MSFRPIKVEPGLVDSANLSNSLDMTFETSMKGFIDKYFFTNLSNNWSLESFVLEQFTAWPMFQQTNKLNDDYPGGDLNGLTAESYFFGKIINHTETMITI